MILQPFIHLALHNKDPAANSNRREAVLLHQPVDARQTNRDIQLPIDPGVKLLGRDQRISLKFSGSSSHIGIDYNIAATGLIDNRSGYTMEHSGKIESYFIQFGGSVAQKYCELLLGENQFAAFSIGWTETLMDVFEKLVLLYKFPASITGDVYASMLMTQILSRLILETDYGHPLFIKNVHVKKVLNLLDEEYMSDLHLNKIAEDMHLNPSYLSRLFFKEVGIPFSSCLTHVRLNHAKELLRITDASIEEIGLRCGFCNASHFVKQFHQSEKMTPLQYRKLHICATPGF